MNIERLVNTETDQNCYIVYDNEKEGSIIDPGSSADIIFDKVKELGIMIKYILLTHCHYDHIEGLDLLRKLTGAKVGASFECNLGIQNPKINVSFMFGNPIKEAPAELILNDNDIIKAGNMEIKTITTPGHTKGGVCYLIDEDLFSGDTLFLRSIGRTDLPGGDFNSIKKSITQKLYTLDDEIIVHPGHGNDTKIYYEKQYNTYINIK